MDMAMKIFWRGEPPVKEREQKFVGFFGCSPFHCAEIWDRLTLSGYLKERTDIRHVHLLWSLFFIKQYLTNTVSAYTVGVCEKTFSSKVWFILEGLASLSSKYVSKIFLFST